MNVEMYVEGREPSKKFLGLYYGYYYPKVLEVWMYPTTYLLYIHTHLPT